MSATITERFARFGNEIDSADVPDDVRKAAALHLLDVVGCGLAAVGLDTATYARGVGASAGSGPATAIGVADPVPAPAAALGNGICCHALDFDDTHPPSIAHVSAVVAPAALAAAEANDASGAELMAALIVGNEVTCRVGRPAADAFHARGFHPTAICGVFGATAAVARLSGLDREATTNALGIAGSMAAGLLAFLTDGSDTKRVHPGWMAHAAHVAVELAASGATGPAAVLEGRSGVYDAFLGLRDVDAGALTDDLGSDWETASISFKPYPACHFLHTPLDAAAALVAEHSFSTEDVDSVRVFQPQAGLDLCAEPIERKRRPATPYETKFSAPFAIAALLHAGEVDAGSFGEPLLSDPAVLAIADRVDCELREYDTFPTSLPGGVRITLRTGKSHERHIPHQRGGAFNPMSRDDVVAKYRRNAELALAERQARRLEELLLGVDRAEALGELRLLAAAAAANR